MPKFTLRIGKDARAFFETTIEADSLDEAQTNIQEHLDTADEHSSWTFAGVDSFDETETTELVDPETLEPLWERYE